MSEDQEENTDVIIDCTPVCWYGTSCYRRNPEHFRSFRHPNLASSSNSVCKETVEIQIEIGHDSKLKNVKSPMGHTHDWTAFTRCANQNATGYFMDKVEYSFPQNLARTPFVVNQPPFNVTDSGSKSFVMNIDISFKDVPDPKKTRIDYDLYLKDNASFSNVRPLKLIFKNPPSDFRQRLLLAGGVMVQTPSATNITNKRKNDDPTRSINDDTVAFGQLCSSKLRKLEISSPTQKVWAEKLISEVLFHAEQKSLTNESCVHLSSQSLTDSEQSVKTEAGLSTSSPELRQRIKSEIDTPPSSTSLDSPSSSTMVHQPIKLEINSPSSSFSDGPCDGCIANLSRRTIAETDPFIIDIKDEMD